jgi:uncharacterized membrane protein
VSTQRDEATPEPPLLPDRRRTLWQIATLLAVAVSLHVVPQMLRDWIPPGLSMVALMLVDALVFATLVRSKGTLRLAGVLAVMFVVIYISHQQNVVALPSIAFNALIAIVFGLSLRPGRTPIILAIATWAMAPEPVKPDFQRYLRTLTLAWAIFFVTMGVIAAVLALAAPFSWWSLFTNVLSWPLIGAFFCGEYLVRRIGFPHLPGHTPLQTIAAALAYPGEALRRAFERS